MEIKTIIEAIDDWGINEPDRVAYQADETHTFGELKQASDALAYYLEKKGRRRWTNCRFWQFGV